ncbi:5-formyltetrahydrofolate cyclo-ligase [Massilia sp. GCM10023247]|uniref:5-formyltetrahydrofolate cyclo-ligase n=1 Tax=Massilia sp. GCM10023247 TaxID=3252643 RepID=UPI003616C489
MSSIAQGSAACGKDAQGPATGDVETQQSSSGTLPPAAPQPQPGASPKAALRKRLKAQRASLDDAAKPERDRRIGAQVLAWWRRTRPPLLAVYWPLSGEPDLQDAYRALALEGAALALPVVVERHAPLAFAAWLPGEPMAVDPMGIAVPARLRTVARPPALLVPCLGFNEHGYRLGYGGGFYDRTLAGGVKPATLGIAYACQIAEFEADLHDLPLDLIVTEETAVE